MAKKRVGLGMLPRLLIGVLVPIVIGFFILGSMIFYSWSVGPVEMTSIRDMGSNSFTQVKTFFLLQSRISMGSLVEKNIEAKVANVAEQISVYVQTNVKANPKKDPQIMLQDPELLKIAVQTVGENDYTAVYDTQGVNIYNVDPQAVGMSLRDLFKDNPEMLKLMESGLKDPTAGYYDYKDKDGKSSTKYIYIIPVKGTNLVAVGATSVEELSRPAATVEKRVAQIESRYMMQYKKNFQIFFMIIILVVIVAVIVFIGRSLIQPIHRLSEVADRISTGDLDTPIDVKGVGEVRALTESFERMQASVRSAIKRLQKK
jgi:HAMP domain-containing protein